METKNTISTKDKVRMLQEQAKAEINRLEAQASAKDVAGKSIGKKGLFYITLIVVIGVFASLFLEEQKIAAVMGLLGASLTALISMLNSIAGANAKQEKPEFEVMKQLIDRLDIYVFATFWSIFAASYIGFITFGHIPEDNQRFADTILGFLLGTVVATILQFFFGSSMGSKEKDKK
jgi:hypothetical protein